jgi:hypothetical protein
MLGRYFQNNFTYIIRYQKSEKELKVTSCLDKNFLKRIVTVKEGKYGHLLKYKIVLKLSQRCLHFFTQEHPLCVRVVPYIAV